MRRAEPGDFPQGKAMLFLYDYPAVFCGLGGGIKKTSAASAGSEGHAVAAARARRRSVIVLLPFSLSPTDDIWRGFP